MTSPRPIGIFEAFVLDVSDLERAAAFWGALMALDFGPSTMPQYRSAELASGLRFILQQVPEHKAAAKNRMHLDVEVDDLDVAFARVKGAGGTLVRRVEDPGYDPFYVCADPDGNEFCLTLPTSS